MPIRKPAHKRTLEDYIKEVQRLENMDTENLLYPSKDTMPSKAINSPVETRSLVLQGGGSLKDWKVSLFNAVQAAVEHELHRQSTWWPRASHVSAGLLWAQVDALLEKIQEST